MKKAIFFDRDGTINVDMIGAYVANPKNSSSFLGLQRASNLLEKRAICSSSSQIKQESLKVCTRRGSGHP